ncbi:MAG: FtsQ-type POTRA domain-containing protein, partial [Atopobiaceae bacterium]
RRGRVDSPAASRSANDVSRIGSSRPMKIVLAIGGAILAAALALFILSNTPVFTVDTVETDATQHISADAIAKLAKVDQGVTLLNVDQGAIQQNLRKNPWVESVSIEREFPDTLKIVVNERKVGAVVLMGGGSIAWYLGEDNVWIEPFRIDGSQGQSGQQIAMAKARELGCLLITDVPSSVSPVAGTASTDDMITDVMDYQDQFSKDFSSQIAVYSAASAESISCTLESGVEVSLGAPSNVDMKESIVTQILNANPGQVTFINVRTPSKPTFRKVGTDSVTAGSVDAATTGASTDAATATDAASATSSADTSASTGSAEAGSSNQ